MAKTIDRKAYEQKLKRAHSAKKANPRSRAPRSGIPIPAQKKRTLREILNTELNSTIAYLEKSPKSLAFERQASLSHGQGMVDFALATGAITSGDAVKYCDRLKKAAGL